MTCTKHQAKTPTQSIFSLKYMGILKITPTVLNMVVLMSIIFEMKSLILAQNERWRRA